MKLQIASYDGHSLSDSSFAAYLPVLDSLAQADGQAGIVERVHFPPQYTYKQPKGRFLTVVVKMKGTKETQIDTLKSWFDTHNDDGLKTLIAIDLANSNKEWYVRCTTVKMPRVHGRLAYFTLYAPDPVWRSNTQNSDPWVITASGQTNTITPGGNLPAFPIFRIKPTSARSGGFNYWRWLPIYNQTTRAFPDYPICLTGAGLDTGALIADTSRSVQINQGGGINNSVTTIPYDTEVGTFPSSGLAYVDTEQVRYTGKTGTNLTGVTRGVNGTSAASHADNAVIRASKMQADGDDVRVYVDGRETDRWLNGMNGATTKIWAVFQLSPKQEFTLDTAIAGAGAITQITVLETAANQAALAAVPPAGILYIDTEAFTYTGKDVANLKFTGVTRTVKGTSIGAHASAATIRWIEHDVYLYYGNASASAPNTDDTKKPAFDLTSTNTSWVYTSFNNGALTLSGGWKPRVVQKKGDSVLMYTGNRLAAADPFTELGFQLKAWLSSNRWQAGDAELRWELYQPAGVTTVTVTGEKYRSGSTWFTTYPEFTGSNNGFRGYPAAQAFTEDSPSAPATWEALDSHSGVALGATYRYLTFGLNKSSCAASASYYVAIEMEACTLTLDSATVPTVAIGSEQTGYELDAIISSDLFSGTIRVRAVVALNQELEVDCDAKTVKYLLDGANRLGSLALNSVRFDWFQLLPGVVNTLTYTETGAAGVEVTTLWRDRNN